MEFDSFKQITRTENELDFDTYFTYVILNVTSYKHVLSVFTDL